MDIQIEPEAPSTIKFLQFVCQELLSHEPLRRGKLIEVHIEKGATPFPEFTENVLSDEKDIKIAKKISDTEERNSKKCVLICYYLRNAFKHHTALQVPAIESQESFSLMAPFVILDPAGLRKMATKLNAAIPIRNDTAIVNKEGNRNKLLDTLYLTATGNLWRTPQNKFCYPIGETSKRYDIIQFLVYNRGFQKTSIISNELKIKETQYVRTTIAKMRRNINRFLKIKGTTLIESKKGSGYRINPDYKIKMLNS